MYHSAKRFLASLLAAATLMSGMGVSALAAEHDDFTLGIYSTTDMHGKCYDVNPIDGRPVKTSYLNVATAMKDERTKVDDSILIDAGDIIQGTPIVSYTMTMQGGRDNPMALCLRYCGYDALIPGNHEFNFTMEGQQRFYDMLEDESGKYPGEKVDVVCANYIDKATQTSRMEPYKIMNIDANGTSFKVGILGFENVNIPNWDVPTHYEGADFVHAENKDRTYAYEWVNYWQKQLREVEKCDFVIVAAHSGEGPDSTKPGFELVAENQVAHLIQNTTGIDMAIAGHNHTPGIYTFQNAEGKDVPVVNGGTSTLTKTLLTIHKDGSFTIGKSEAIDITTYQRDEGLAALTKPYYDQTVPFVEQEIGTVAGKWDDVADHYHVQSDTVNFVHEAQLWATGADISITNPVTARGFYMGQMLSDGKVNCPISLKNCYSFYRYDNNLLYMIRITGKQVRDWLERCADEFSVDENGKVVGGGFGSDQIYGLDYDIFLGSPRGQRIRNLSYQGKPVTDDQVFKAAVNSYRLSANAAGDAYGWYETTGITLGTDNILWDGSVSDQFGSISGSCTLIMAEYIKSLTAEGKQMTPPEARSHWSYQKPVSRLEFVEQLYAAVGGKGGNSDAKPFTDVENSAALAWAAEQGIVKGDGTGKFLPEAPVSREQAALILLNYARVLGKGPQGAWAVRIPYTDVQNVSAWAMDGVMWNVLTGLVPAEANGSFLPQGSVNAEQAAAMIAGVPNVR